MAAKLAQYAELADRQTRQITGSRESWTGFLATAGRMYKYPYEEQLLIYAQRPEATACAPLEMWNNPLNRFVKRGSKGIALIDNSGSRPRLRYVFDVADTEAGRQNPRKLFLWELKPEHIRPVIESLAQAYYIESLMNRNSISGGTSSEHEMGEVILGLAHNLAARYYEHHSIDIANAAGGSFLANYAAGDRKVTFQSALAVSAAYSIMTRCGINPSVYLDDEDFLPIFDFNTADSVNVLGRAVSDLAEEVLRNIEITVKNYEREKTAARERSQSHERTDLHTERGLSAPGHQDPGNAPAKQIRDDAEELPPGTPPNPVHEPGFAGNVVSPLFGDRASGGPQTGTDHSRAAQTEPASGQRDQPPGLDRTHEQPASPGGRSNLQGADLQLNQEPPEADIPPAKPASTVTPSQPGGVAASPAVEITNEDIDAALIAWNGDYASINRVYEYLLEQARARETAAFLQTEYGQAQFTVTKDGAEPVVLPWTKVQRRIVQLMDLEQFKAIDEPAATIEPAPGAKPEPETTSEPDVKPEAEIEATPSPKPVFIPDRNDIRSLDLSLYNDGDIIGYDKNGVEYRLSRIDERAFVSTTTRITPIGGVLGMADIPANILQKIRIANGLEAEEPEPEGVTEQQGQPETERVAEPPGDPATEQVTEEPEQTEGQNVFEQSPAASSSQMTESSAAETIQQEQMAPAAPDPVQPVLDFTSPRTLADHQQSEPPMSSTQPNLFDIPDSPAPTEPVFTEPLPAETDLPQQTQSPVNFRITDDHLGEGGAKTKFSRNIAAIKTLHIIESENRPATPEEQEILAQYVGWGGLPQAFDQNNEQWAGEYLELKTLLSPGDYDMARASTLNAHYTSPTVIKAMYETLERLGFKEGNILEPACGVGNFFGLLPESMVNAKLYGVELDSVTGRIAKQLYPQADIKVTGFEKTAMPDAFFDVAIGNVPFGAYKLNDKRYDKQNFLIHDYFFAKALDQVRPGGIVAFITSKGTLDKANPTVRKYIAQRAELLGAVRLPNDAFLKNAGTAVTSDIIFLQKRDRLLDIQPDWVHLSRIKDADDPDNSIPVNSYFAEHPEMILGVMAYDNKMYGNNKETTCNPIEGAELGEQLREALAHIQGQITEYELDDIEGIRDISIPADPAVRNFSYTVADDIVYYRENSRMHPVDMPSATLERVKGMVELRNCVRELIEYQLYDYPDSDIKAKQTALNTLYDSFSRQYGLINSNANQKAFSADSAYYLLCSLEILDENGELQKKSDMFSKRTIKQKIEITSVDTSGEALAVSIAKKARVDMDYMQTLTGFNETKIVADLQRVIFRVPGQEANGQPVYQAADEYLSGNVREKLALARQAAAANPAYDINVKALEQAQPKDLEAAEIAVRLGSTWIDKEYIQQFMYELLQTPYYQRPTLKVNFTELTGEWHISGKNRAMYSDVLANVTYGTDRVNAYRILQDTLNLKDTRIYDTKEIDGREIRVLNKKETTLAQQKQEAVKQAFKDWIFQDPERRQTLVKFYNERFNSIRPREYDGAHIEFAGMSPEIILKQHQKDAVARILYGGNTLLAHEVGAGKTFEMVGAAMESKRLGLCRKSLLAVPNHLTEQMAAEFLRLYPAANILVATKKDFTTANRKKFCAKIATGDYDAVIIGHSQIEKIPLSKERQERLLREQIGEITAAIEEMHIHDGERFTIKRMEKTRRNLEARLVKLTDDSRKDDVVTFEQLGVDRLFVDESQAFKNLFLYTKMRNVAGLSQSEAQKSTDMFLKCRYLDELTGNKGVIFATGTPVTNSMTELYTVQRYLQYDTLQSKKLIHFDAWASTFGETQTSVELAPEGNGYRARTRFAKFSNLPELMSMFKEAADIKTADVLDLPRPKANFHTVVVKPTELQKEMVRELSVRAQKVHEKMVDPTEDNMLKITSDGRKIGLDQRLMNPLLPDDPSSKVNACMENIYAIWERTADKRLTQAIFCDFSTPNADKRFNVYEDIKSKLIAKGIPAAEIAFIHDANTEAQKKELFAKVRQGKVRVLFGSTFKMGAGTNIRATRFRTNTIL